MQNYHSNNKNKTIKQNDLQLTRLGQTFKKKHNQYAIRRHCPLLLSLLTVKPKNIFNFLQHKRVSAVCLVNNLDKM